MQMKTIFFIFCMLLQNRTFAALPDADKLLKNWKDAMYTDQEASSLRLTISPSGQSPIIREADVYYKSLKGKQTKVMMKFTSPSKIKGTAFLSLKESSDKNSDQWIYFPAYNKARRLSSRGKDDAFLDSDFSNGDISFEYHQNFKFKVNGEGKLGKVPVYVVEGVSSPGSETAYAKQMLYISKDTNLNVKTDFYDKKGVLFKTLTVKKWTKYQDHWAIDIALMQNIPTKSETLIEITNRNTKTAPADKLFTLVNLERGQ